MSYIGNPPVISATRTVTEITATAGQTVFNANGGYTVGFLDVFVNGAQLQSSDFTATNGSSVTLAQAALVGDDVRLVAWGTFNVANAPAGGTDWQSVQASNFTAAAGKGYPINTTSGAVTATLPASPTAGQFIQLTDYARTFGTNNLTINPNGNKIQSSTSNIVVNTSGTSVGLVYVDSTQGWIAYDGFSTSPIASYTVSYLVLAGGGSGGNGLAGGGGAGGLLTGTTTLVPGTAYTITVGAGGAAGSDGAYSRGNNGTNSSISGVSITSIGGGGGGAYSATSTPTTADGANGGSGGGGGGADNANTRTWVGGSGTSGQGNAGGNGGPNASSSGYSGGGGGGSFSVGGTATLKVAGNGGSGTSSSISGSSVTYAGGGGGGAYSVGSGVAGSGGSGGGGNGGLTTRGTSAPANTGSGGGGGGYVDPGAQQLAGGSGGSGIVIISYAGSQRGTGGTVTSSGGNTIHTFTSSGTYTA